MLNYLPSFCFNILQLKNLLITILKISLIKKLNNSRKKIWDKDSLFLEIHLLVLPLDMEDRQAIGGKKAKEICLPFLEISN